MSLEASFERALEGAKNGENASWALIYDDLAPAVHAYLRVRGAPDPEDLVGEVFLQLARNIGRFDGDYRGFRSWTFIVAHHRLIDARRRQRRRREVSEEPALLEAADPTTDTEELVLGNPRLSWVAEALEGLTDTQRDVILLRVLGGLSVGDTAAAVGKRPGAVRVIQHRALAILRERITDGHVTR